MNELAGTVPVPRESPTHEAKPAIRDDGLPPDNSAFSDKKS
jgi:hypothetical protein